MIALRLFFWLCVWIGGLVLAGRRYSACLDEGSVIPGCDHRLEYLGWAVALMGLIMSARALRAFSVAKGWSK